MDYICTVYIYSRHGQGKPSGQSQRSQTETNYERKTTLKLSNQQILTRNKKTLTRHDRDETEREMEVLRYIKETINKK